MVDDSSGGGRRERGKMNKDITRFFVGSWAMLRGEFGRNLLAAWFMGFAW